MTDVDVGAKAEEQWAPPPPVHPSRLIRKGPAGMPLGSSRPMTEAEYEHAMTGDVTLWARTGEKYYHPHRCVWERVDGRDPTPMPRVWCEVMVEDPRVVRYCVKHALMIGYPLTIEDQQRMSEFEARHALKRLASEAVAVVREVMHDQDAPPGVRAKAAADVLDRTGLHPKSEVGIEAKVTAEVVDITQIIRERLDAKRARLLGPEGEAEVVEGEVLELRPAPAGDEIKPPPGF